MNTGWMTLPWIVPSGAAAIFALWLFWVAFSKRPGRSGQRIGLWLAALFFTFYGPFSAASPAWPLEAWAREINNHGDFKDLWLAMIAMLVFSLSNIADNLIRTYKDISKFSQFLTPIVLAAYFIGIVLGMSRYSVLAAAKFDANTFETYWTIVWAATAFGILWELLIAIETRD
jgi:hypothetical protein